MTTSHTDTAIRFTGRNGRLMIGSEAIEVTFFSITRDKYAYTDPWVLEAQLQDSEITRAEMLIKNPAEVTFIGLTGHMKTVRTGPFEFANISEHSLETHVDELDVSWGTPTFPPTSQRLEVELTVTPVLNATVSDVGSILGIASTSQTDKASIQLSYGRFEVSFLRQFATGTISNNECTLTLTNPALVHSQSDEKGCDPVWTLIEEFEEELDDLCSLLTFLSRDNVTWREISLQSRTGVPLIGTRHTHEKLRRTRTLRRSVRLSPLATLRTLGPDGLNALYQAYRALPNKEVIANAIAFLVTVYSDGFLEDQIVSAFTALETLKSGLAAKQSLTMEDEDFKKLKKALTKEIDNFASERNLKNEAVAVKGKLRELQRTPVVGVVADLVKSTGIVWADLWPTRTDLKDALKSAFDRRNDLIHTGALTDSAASADDYVRVHVLAERLIFHVLGGQAAWLAPKAYAQVLMSLR